MTIPGFLRAPLRPFTATIALPTAADAADAPPCPGCEAPIADRFCAACGEPRPATDLSLLAIVAGGVENLTSLDVRLLRTVRALVTRPGFLTAEYRRGVRARYTRPLQLFLLVMAIFFVAMPYFGAGYNTRAILGLASVTRPATRAGDSGPTLRSNAGTPRQTADLRARSEAIMRRTHETPDAFVARLDRRTDDVKRGLLALFVPVLAAALWLLYAGQRRYVVEHFVFATHLFTFVLALCAGWMALMNSAGRVAGMLDYGSTRSSAPTVLIVGSLLGGFGIAVFYLWAALRRAYGSSWWGAALRTLALGFALFMCVGLYQQALFGIAMRLM